MAAGNPVLENILRAHDLEASVAGRANVRYRRLVMVKVALDRCSRPGRPEAMREAVLDELQLRHPYLLAYAFVSVVHDRFAFYLLCRLTA